VFRYDAFKVVLARHAVQSFAVVFQMVAIERTGTSFTESLEVVRS
jgi:hypothetical protein